MSIYEHIMYNGVPKEMSEFFRKSFLIFLRHFDFLL